MKIVTYAWTRDKNYVSGWFRVYGFGLLLKSPNAPYYFSEREGYTKFIRILGWRIGFVKP